MRDIYRLNAAIAMRPIMGLSAHPATRAMLDVISRVPKAPPVIPLVATARPHPAPIVIDMNVHLHLHGDAGDGATGE